MGTCRGFLDIQEVQRVVVARQEAHELIIGDVKDALGVSQEGARGSDGRSATGRFHGGSFGRIALVFHGEGGRKLKGQEKL